MHMDHVDQSIQNIQKFRGERITNLSAKVTPFKVQFKFISMSNLNNKMGPNVDDKMGSIRTVNGVEFELENGVDSYSKWG